MKHPHFLLFLAAALGAPAYGQSALPGSADPASLAARPAGEAVARAALEAARHDAQVHFWLDLAASFNTSGSRLGESVRAAWAQRQSAVDFAQAQYRARLEVCALLGNEPYDPPVDPAQFSPDVSNPWFPLVPGRVLVYEGQTPEGLERREVTVLDQVAEIAGVRCRAVREVETRDGVVFEDTYDWYAQHASGDVWYFGEVSLHYKEGFLDNLSGSWRAGQNGARPGVVMRAHPAPGDAYRQEFLLGVAEDVARVAALGETVQGPLGTFTGCARFTDWSPIEPHDGADKYVDPGTGIILEVNLQTGARLDLVEVR